MKDIKFRAFHKIHKYMFDDNVAMIDFLNKTIQYNKIPLKDCELMQYTGLKDCEGKEIFEGDIVESKNNFYTTNIAEVRWLEKRASFYLIAKTTGTDIINKEPFESAYKMNSQKIKILGNIHQNPELLEINKWNKK